MPIAIVDRETIADVKMRAIEEQLSWITMPTMIPRKSTSHL
jgi:hypothetical protein